MRNIQIAIDGPVGAGKSTIAKMVAEELNILYLDTGSMYRAVGYTALERNILLEDEAAVTALSRAIDIEIKLEGKLQKVFVGGVDVTGELRQHEISNAASVVSSYGGVREVMVSRQREIAQGHDVVMDGRDIATHVLPDAKYKFYLTASVDERAKRRFAETRSNNVTFEQIKRDIIERDTRDTTRKHAPLKKAPGAHVIDTTNMPPNEVVSHIIGYVDINK